MSPATRPTRGRTTSSTGGRSATNTRSRRWASRCLKSAAPRGRANPSSRMSKPSRSNAPTCRLSSSSPPPTASSGKAPSPPRKNQPGKSGANNSAPSSPTAKPPAPPTPRPSPPQRPPPLPPRPPRRPHRCVRLIPSPPCARRSRPMPARCRSRRFTILTSARATNGCASRPPKSPPARACSMSARAPVPTARSSRTANIARTISKNSRA